MMHLFSVRCQERGGRKKGRKERHMPHIFHFKFHTRLVGVEVLSHLLALPSVPLLVSGALGCICLVTTKLHFVEIGCFWRHVPKTCLFLPFWMTKGIGVCGPWANVVYPKEQACAKRKKQDKKQVIPCRCQCASSTWTGSMAWSKVVPFCSLRFLGKTSIHNPYSP